MKESVKDYVKISRDDDGWLIKNTAQPLKSEVAEALAARRRTHRDLLALDHEPVRTPKMRRESAELRRRLNTMGVPRAEVDRLKADLRSAATKQSDHIKATLKDRRARRERLLAPEKHIQLGLGGTAPVDNSFWWAETQPFINCAGVANFVDEGTLRFITGLAVIPGDSKLGSFGAVAYFSLQPERFPTSPSGVLSSAPHAELFGGIVLNTADGDLWNGDSKAQCALFLRQTILQWDFGPNGPVARIIAEASGYDYFPWKWFLVDTGGSTHEDCPGYTPIPPLTYNQSDIWPQDLWAQIEVRFDIYVRSSAFVDSDNVVDLRYSQWAPVPA